MQSLQEQLEIYQSFHTKQATKITHYIGIPAIMIGALMFLNWFTIGIFNHWFVSFAWLLFAALIAYYFVLNWKYALITGAAILVLTIIVTWLSPEKPTTYSVIAFAIFFIGGWILQFIGHAIEGNKPAFTKSFWQTLVAPIFLVAEVMQKFGKEIKL